MAKTLVLAEMPSVARELARVLGCKQSGEGYLEGEKYIVTWALGHLVELAPPEDYDKAWAKWDMLTLPMLPERMKTVVIPQSGRQFRAVQAQLRRGDVGELVIATDAGREGELVARWILEKAGWKGPARRLWISSQTDKAIREGFTHLRPAAEYDNLFRSARARSEADWLVGLNVTRALTCRHNAQLSAGRVQTPTLALIVEREEAIRRFVPQEFWTVTAKLPGFTATWRDPNGQARLFDRERAEALAARLAGKEGMVTRLKRTRRPAPPPGRTSSRSCFPPSTWSGGGRSWCPPPRASRWWAWPRRSCAAPPSPPSGSAAWGRSPRGGSRRGPSWTRCGSLPPGWWPR